MSGLKLYTYPGNFRAFKILVAAEYNGIDIEIPDFKMLEDNTKPEFLAKSPLGKVPVLETPQGSIFESNAIARYVARMRRDTELCGTTFFESGQVDSWIDFCSHELELSATMWFYPVLGYMPANEAAIGKARADLAKALGVLESYLLDRTYLVGEKITLADITVCSTLVYPMKLVLSPEFRAQFPCVMRYFLTVVNQPQFKAVVGEVVLAETELTPSGISPAKAIITGAGGKGKGKGGGKKEKGGGGGKKDKAPKEKKEKKEKAAPAPKPAAEEAPKKKEEHPLKVLDKTDPSPFIMDAWKKLYSNTSDYDACMDEFWKMYDAKGYSIWLGRYNYNDENKVLFMTSNLVGGFVQRSGEIRKWLFGVMQITEQQGEGYFHVDGVYLIRGDSIKPLIDCNDDAEYYTWTKVDTESPEQRQLVKDFWISETELEGRAIKDCKVFK